MKPIALQPAEVRALNREELTRCLRERGVDHSPTETDSELRTKLLNHEAAQACPFWG